MSDIMRPVPFQELVGRIFGEYRNHGTVFGIHKENFYRAGRHSVEVFGQKCSTPLGPAAGPHTQLAQNIVSAYLAGGRFMELKTVQIMDYLGEKKMIAKPCIDARDEGHNVEWSTEYTLPKAYDEYLKAWFVLHLLEAAFGLGWKDKPEEPDFIFNMSVGYNLEGIKQPRMQAFIDGLMDARGYVSPDGTKLFEQYREELRALIAEGEFYAGTDAEKNVKALENLADSISPHICSSVTISTMHGCPPQEIEAICTYMLTEKKLNTFVKLNPTLLGYEKVREILDATGFDHVQLKRESFEHDLQYPDAVSMLKRLAALAAQKGLGFGVKLTNTLGNANDGAVLPGDERYMSGRALLPISTAVAAKLSEEFDGKLPVSYSGGATVYSVKALFDSGIRPITVATDILKPGGYSRLGEMVRILEKKSRAWNRNDIDTRAVKKLSEDSLKAQWTQKDFRGDKPAKALDGLPMFDCYVSPCMQACPIHQNIPDYISLAGEGRYAEALAVIYQDNALPNITCNICDHKCQTRCARLDYEGPVQIRQIKKIAVEHGTAQYMKEWEPLEAPANVRAAVVGAGPAGLSAAYFLARAGFDTSIFEREANAGGVVANIIPQFRISPEAVQADIDFVAAHGVSFHYGVKPEDITVKALKKAGFDYIFYAVGAEKDNELVLEENRPQDSGKGKDGKGARNILGALEFLENYRKNAGFETLGKHVVVTGGGNTAMDSARAAKRTPGVEDVTVVYRRSRKEMPADPEEYELALADGIKFVFLANPSKLENNTLTCRKMALGEPDASGRRRPVETDETYALACDVLITAIGEHTDTEAVVRYGVPCNEKGRPSVVQATNETKEENVFAVGDMTTGPSTVVNCIASARKAVEAAIDKVLKGYEEGSCGCGHEHEGECDPDHECGCHGGENCCKDEAHTHEHGAEAHVHEHGACCCHTEGTETEGSDTEETEDTNIEDADTENAETESDFIEDFTKAEDEFFRDIQYKKTHLYPDAAKTCSDFSKGAAEFARQEAARCMDCTYYCNKCVDVCPNRANAAIDMRFSDFTEDPFQILHLDAFCNECGNCATFCHHQGKPYRDKFTLFSRPEDFDDSTNSGFLVVGDEVKIRENGTVRTCRMDGEGNLTGIEDGIVKDLIEQVFICYNYLLGPVGE